MWRVDIIKLCRLNTLIASRCKILQQCAAFFGVVVDVGGFGLGAEHERFRGGAEIVSDGIVFKDYHRCAVQM